MGSSFTGLHSLEAVSQSDHYVRHFIFRGSIAPVMSNDKTERENATFKIVPGLANGQCYSFESVNHPNWFLRHSLFALVLSPNDGSQLLKEDATFYIESGLSGEGYSFRSFNHPDKYIRHTRPNILIPDELWLDSPSGNNFKKDSTFNIVSPVSSSSSAKTSALLIGDSITEQFKFHAGYYPGTRVWENKGVFGDTTDGLVQKIATYDVGFKDIFLMIGVNDLLHHNSPPALVSQNINIIVRQLKERYPDASITLQSALPTRGLYSRINDEIINLNSLLKGVASQNGVSFYDLHSFFKGGDGQLDSRFTFDGLHLIAEGYRLWGEKLGILTR